MSGLTVGYTSIDPLQLEIKLQNGTEQEKMEAKKIMPILKNKHLLIATLLLGNALAMESLPIFLDSIFSASTAVLLSTTVILIFGEIVPQAICIGSRQLTIAAATAPLTQKIITITYPVTYPISLALDYFLGKHSDSFRFKSKDLKTLIQLHENKGDKNGLSQEEVKIISSTLELRRAKAEDVMIKTESLFYLNDDDILDRELLQRVQKKNYSKIPILTSNGDCKGFIKAKCFIDWKSLKGRTVGSLKHLIYPPVFVNSSLSLLECLNILEKNRESLIFVASQHQRATTHVISDDLTLLERRTTSPIDGIVILKDIFEKIVEKEFDDRDIHFSAKNLFFKKKEKTERIDQDEEDAKEPLLVKGTSSYY